MSCLFFYQPSTVTYIITWSLMCTPTVVQQVYDDASFTITGFKYHNGLHKMDSNRHKHIFMLPYQASYQLVPSKTQEGLVWGKTYVPYSNAFTMYTCAQENIVLDMYRSCTNFTTHTHTHLYDCTTDDNFYIGNLCYNQNTFIVTYTSVSTVHHSLWGNILLSRRPGYRIVLEFSKR